MIVIRQKITSGHRLNRKEWRAVSKLGWHEAGEYWHRELLPKHFEVGAYREYRYVRRSRKYEERKRRLHGHNRPMVFNGDLRRAVLRQREVTVAGNQSGVRQGAAKIKLSGPRYLRGVHRGRGPNFRAELQAISNRDGRKLASVMDRLITSELRKAGPKTRVRGR